MILKSMLIQKKSRAKLKNKGFTLFEVIIAIAIVAIAILGLAQLFTYSVLNNSRSDRITNATFLAQQQIDVLRNMTGTELSNLTADPIDEQIDVNSDGTYDFRRITQVQAAGLFWEVRILVFSAEQIAVAKDTLIQNPSQYRVKADVRTIISR